MKFESSHLVFSVVDAPLPPVIEAVQRIFADKYRLRFVACDCDAIYQDAPRPGGAHPAKGMFYAVSDTNCSVFVANYQDGWVTLMHRLSRQANFRVVHVASSEGRYPHHSIEVIESGETRRYVRASKDGSRWEFYEQGAPLPFEEPELYNERLKKHRLNRLVITRYLLRCGWAIQDPEFWSSTEQALLVEDRK